MYLPVESGRLIEGPVNRGPDNRGCTVFNKFYKMSKIFEYTVMIETLSNIL